MNRNGFKAAAPEGPINRWDLGRLALAKAGFARSITAHYANYGQDIGLIFLRQPRHNSGEILSEFPISSNKRAHRDDLVGHFLTSKESIVIDIAFG